MRRVLVCVVVLVVGVLGWQVGGASADDVIVFAQPASQPVADAITQIRIGVSVDSSFPGGSVDVTTKASGDCAQTPDQDSGAPARFLHGNAVGKGPLTLTPQKSGIVALVTLHQGPNVICAWLSDSSGIVLTGNAVGVIARPGTLLRGWNQNTVACGAVTRSDAAQALNEPTSTVGRHGGAWTPGLNAFEQEHSSYCDWTYTKTKTCCRDVFLILSPEQTRPTLAHARMLYQDTGGTEKVPGPCWPVTGIGTTACVYRGTVTDGAPGFGELLAVQGHLIVQLHVELVPPTAQDTPVRIETQERSLAHKILARVAIAHH